MNKNRKSIGRRRSHSVAGFASKDLCEIIPTSLSPSERLLMLLERSFQYTLSVVQKEFTFNENFDTSHFRKQAAICWEKIRAILDERNICHIAVTQDTLSSESFLAADVGQCNKAIVELESEFNKWNDCIASHREALKKEIDSPCTVNSSEWRERDQLYDYSGVLKETSSIHEKLFKQVATLSAAEASVARYLRPRHSLNNKYLLHKRCERHFKQKIQNSPRTLIKKMVCASKIVKPTHFS